jgi:hypothetical protein
MSVLYVLLAAILALIIWQLARIRPDTREADEVLSRTQEMESADEQRDLLALELGARIFNSADSQVIVSETWPDFARWFHSRRKMLALDWLREVRGHVRQIIREHRQAARQRPDADPVDELKLAVQFLLFELASGILYALIWMRDPADLSTVVESFLDGTARLRRAVDRALPAAGPTAETAKN